MDITFKTEEGKFNYRVAVIIKKDNKYLVTKHQDMDYISLIGGRVKTGETSMETAIRETEEEVGYQTRFVKSLGIFENFFIMQYTNIPYHEILIIHELEFTDKSIYDLESIPNKEGKKDCYVWKTKKELEEYLVPKEVLNHLEDNSFFHDIIKD